MQLEQWMQAVVGLIGLCLLLENRIMLEVRLVTGASIVGIVCPIMTPPITTCRRSVVLTWYWLRMLLTGVPIFTSRFFGSATSPLRVVTLDIKGSPSNTAFAIALMVATF